MSETTTLDEPNRLAQLAYRLGRAPLLGCLPRNRDKIHRIHAPTSWGGLQRFARKEYAWHEMMAMPLALFGTASNAYTAGSGSHYRIDFP